jgi:hypothetical protein
VGVWINGTGFSRLTASMSQVNMTDWKSVIGHLAAKRRPSKLGAIHFSQLIYDEENTYQILSEKSKCIGNRKLFYETRLRERWKLNLVMATIQKGQKMSSNQSEVQLVNDVAEKIKQEKMSPGNNNDASSLFSGACYVTTRNGQRICFDWDGLGEEECKRIGEQSNAFWHFVPMGKCES